MKIRLAHGLAYVEVILTFQGRSLCLSDTVLDTGSASTIFSADRLLEIGVVPEPPDTLHRIRGVGGTEYAFTKRLDLLAMGEGSGEEMWLWRRQVETTSKRSGVAPKCFRAAMNRFGTSARH